MGDHVAVSRGLFQHHGVDLGDGTVAQYGGDISGKGDCQVEIVSVEAFARGGEIRVIYNPRRFSAPEIARRARSRVGEQSYALFHNNCEHFVNWCRSGEARSRQVDRALERSTAVVTKSVTAAVTKTGAKAATKFASPWLLAADAAQFSTEVVASRMGANDVQAQKAGQYAGAGASVGIGAWVAGPLGAAAGFGIWAVGEALGKALSGDRAAGHDENNDRNDDWDWGNDRSR